MFFWSYKYLEVYCRVVLKIVATNISQLLHSQKHTSALNSDEILLILELSCHVALEELLLGPLHFLASASLFASSIFCSLLLSTSLPLP